MNTPMLEYVMTELQARKGQWRTICKQIKPDETDSYYSWLTKLAQEKIDDPGVNKVQELYDWLRANPRTEAA